MSEQSRAVTDAMGMAADSRTVAAWILASRVTGFGRVTALAAVLGPTYFGNLFQACAVLPSTLYGLFAGSLVSALLVPPLVRRIDRGEGDGARRVANGVLGMMTLVMLALAVLLVLAGPVLVAVLTLGVADPAVRNQQLRLGLPLLPIMMPQLVLYAVAGAGVAVQQAHGRFALAAAAPALENVVFIFVLVASALLFGTGTDPRDVGMPQLLLLGLGTTAAVALHAGAQWWGAWRAGIALVPTAHWNEEEIRSILRRGGSSIGYTGLHWTGFLSLLITGGTVPGGVAAFQIAYNVCQVPVALTATPLAAAQLPRLSRSHDRNMAGEFGETYRTSLRLTLFAVLPIAVILVAIPHALAQAVAFGEMAKPAAVALIAAGLGSLGAGVVGEAIFVLATSAAYARHDVKTPLYAMTLRFVMVGAGVALARTTSDDVRLLWTLGATLTGANLLAGAYLNWRQLRTLPGRDAGGFAAATAGLAISALSALPAVLVTAWLSGEGGTALRHGAVAIAAVSASMAAYLGLQTLRESPELRLLIPASGRWSFIPLPRPGARDP